MTQQARQEDTSWELFLRRQNELDAAKIKRDEQDQVLERRKSPQQMPERRVQFCLLEQRPGVVSITNNEDGSRTVVYAGRLVPREGDVTEVIIPAPAVNQR